MKVVKTNATKLIERIKEIAYENIEISENLFKARGPGDFVARSYRQKALFSILLLKELEAISPGLYQSMLERANKGIAEATKEEKDLGLDIEDLEYGDAVELENEDICVYIRKELDTSGGMITQELNLVNIFTGEEHNINSYNDDLTHCTTPEYNVKKFTRINKIVVGELPC